MHIATAAFMVFHQYKLTLPLLEYDDLRRKIEMRTDVLYVSSQAAFPPFRL